MNYSILKMSESVSFVQRESEAAEKKKQLPSTSGRLIQEHHQSVLLGTDAKTAVDDQGPDILEKNFITQQGRSKLDWGFS